MQDQKLFWIGFNLVKGIGAARLQALLDYFGDIEKAWHASVNALRSAGLGPKTIQSLVQVRQDVSLERLWERIQRQDIQVVIWGDPNYPRRLMDIDYPPPVIYLHGNILPEDDWAVAVVGTRRVTGYGRRVTEDLVAFLAHNGITVVSGLARGIDGIAHRVALAAGGRTIAVLGSGVDCIYPPEHRDLAAQIAQAGAVLSDYALGTPPESANFPPRNRIISGLSLAVVVVEAGSRSGALITARFAADQGREVFAVPGAITAPQSVGTNRLIRDGARPLLKPQELLEMLEITLVQQHQTARKIIPADEFELKILQALRDEPRHVDEISIQVKLPIEKVTSTLTLMELKGMVRQMGSMHYVALRELAEHYRVTLNHTPGDDRIVEK